MSGQASFPLAGTERAHGKMAGVVGASMGVSVLAAVRGEGGVTAGELIGLAMESCQAQILRGLGSKRQPRR